MSVEEIQYLKELIENQIDYLKELIDQRSLLTQRAIDKAEASVDERLAGMNEFRAQQADMISKFATLEKLESIREQFNIQIITINKGLDELNQWKAGAQATSSQFKGIIEDVNDLKIFKANTQGRQTVIQIVWPIAVGIITFILGKVFK